MKSKQRHTSKQPRANKVDQFRDSVCGIAFSMDSDAGFVGRLVRVDPSHLDVLQEFQLQKLLAYSNQNSHFIYVYEPGNGIVYETDVDNLLRFGAIFNGPDGVAVFLTLVGWQVADPGRINKEVGYRMPAPQVVPGIWQYRC